LVRKVWHALSYADTASAEADGNTSGAPDAAAASHTLAIWPQSHIRFANALRPTISTLDAKAMDQLLLKTTAKQFAESAN
jgi:hypothetical protein